MKPSTVVARDARLDPVVAQFLHGFSATGHDVKTEVSVDEARRRMRGVEGPSADLPGMDIEELEIPGTVAGPVALRVVRPPFARGWLPAIVYLHGGGWVFGDADTHDWVVRALALASQRTVVFVDYHRSPEARFPIAIEESYRSVAWLAEHGGSLGIRGEELAIAGDSAGGNLATVTCSLAKERRGPTITHQLLFYPTTDAAHAFGSFNAYERGYYLTADDIWWSQSQYLGDETAWDEPTISPLRSALESLSGLPPALVVTAEMDPLRDEGEAYARRLMEAGVPVIAVRFLGTIHAFLTLRGLAATSAPGAAIALAADLLSKRALK